MLNFYLVIPENLLSNKDLSAQEKLLFVLISGLITSKGYCEETNKFFGEYFDSHPTTISKWLNRLAESKYVVILINQEDGNKRYIFTPESIINILTGKIKLAINIDINELIMFIKDLDFNIFTPIGENTNTPIGEFANTPPYILETNKETIISNKEINNSNKETQLELFNKESESPRKTSEKTRCLFVNSKFSNFDDFKTQFSEDSFKDIDLFYYYNAVKDWSSSKDKRMKDWIATARNFMRSDRNRNQLKVKVENVSENNNFKKFLQL